LLAMSDGYQHIFTRLAGMSALYRLAVSGPLRLAFLPPPDGCQLCPRVPPLSSCQNRPWVFSGTRKRGLMA